MKIVVNIKIKNQNKMIDKSNVENKYKDNSENDIKRNQNKNKIK